MARNNAAYQLEMPARRLERAVKARHNSSVKAISIPKSHNAKIVTAILLVAIVAFSICWRYVEIYNNASLINQKQTQLTNLQNENSQIEMAIGKQLDKTSLNAYAKTVLGMSSPQKHQYVYIDLTDEDVMQAPTQKTPTSPWIVKFWNGIIDYFK